MHMFDSKHNIITQNKKMYSSNDSDILSQKTILSKTTVEDSSCTSIEESSSSLGLSDMTTNTTRGLIESKPTITESLYNNKTVDLIKSFSLRNSVAIYKRALRRDRGKRYKRKNSEFESFSNSTGRGCDLKDVISPCSTIKLKPNHSRGQPKASINMENTPIYFVGPDIMANILLYLDPPEVRNIISIPLSTQWQAIYTYPQDIWKILCLSKPFYAKFDDTANEKSSNSIETFPLYNDLGMRHKFGIYRFLYTSFVNCVLYLEKLKLDFKNGAPSLVSNSGNTPDSSRTSRKRNRKAQNEEHDVKVEDRSKIRVKKAKIGISSLTVRLLGTSKDGTPGYLKLPLTFALFSIVNWMSAFSDVLGIQIMFLRILPGLLEDEHQRMTAQRTGLTDIILREMVLFPDSVELHTAAFHAFVLLARPLGGKECMVLHTSLENSDACFNIITSSGRNGIAVMLDSMGRFSSHEDLQAMGCWSMVNIALVPSQKTMLVKLGGISVALNAMMMHQRSAEVQFRAVFALINLVIPSNPSTVEKTDTDILSNEQLLSVNEVTEKEILDENIAQIVNLTVIAMKNFFTNEAILNRCCLVLHNICLTEEYHTTLLWTPNCYQMLEWALANYRNDQVMQQSAGGTLHRLQSTLATDSNLRVRFAASVRVQ